MYLLLNTYNAVDRFSIAYYSVHYRHDLGTGKNENNYLFLLTTFLD